eukprot:TRINITY_DN7196_c0_g1_i1.p1 TRINITY_DN7196_c0_g1~~TRINITY_DN7196_c0_g1_i1.p1  ORF type:complete len:168 (+),score=35.54 TRINITY_DN7196_c0_g1_i1:34-537(+)
MTAPQEIPSLVLPYAFVFFDLPPRNGMGEKVEKAVLRFSQPVKTSLPMEEFIVNPYDTLPSFYQVVMLDHHEEFFWVIELNDYRLAKCGAACIESEEKWLSIFKNLEVTNKALKVFQEWLEQKDCLQQPIHPRSYALLNLLEEKKRSLEEEETTRRNFKNFHFNATR